MSCDPDIFEANRPEPLLSIDGAFGADSNTHPYDAAVLLLDGNYVVLEENYTSGLGILAALKNIIFGRSKPIDFSDNRDKRSLFHSASNNLMVPIENNSIALQMAPSIGWLKTLYEDKSDFFLPMPKIQGLNSSWQWYIKGIKYPMLDFPIRPFYGAYFPTRFEHLRIFDKWMKSFNGEKTQAIDIGTGCGILTFILLNQGFKRVYASDTNPNALISICKTALENKLSDKIILNKADMLQDCPVKSELIVFNPPWLPADSDLNGIDTAIYYPDTDFFNRFFSGAAEQLLPGGTLLFLFSNFASANKITEFHPVKHELESYNRFIESDIIRQKVKKASRSTRRSDWRKDEYVELWVLKQR